MLHTHIQKYYKLSEADQEELATTVFKHLTLMDKSTSSANTIYHFLHEPRNPISSLHLTDLYINGPG